MLNTTVTFVIATFLDALSREIYSLVSNSSEPFNTDIGLLIGQVIMIIFTLYVWLAIARKYLLHLGRNHESIRGIGFGTKALGWDTTRVDGISFNRLSIDKHFKGDL